MPLETWALLSYHTAERGVVMALDTQKNYRNLVMYSVFIRNHTKEGTFRALVSDLDRIKALGVDIVWLMPIHPLGEKARKGSLGSPYAIRDYRAVNPEYGTLEDFRYLVDEIHARGMRCIIDVVYNHTSPDSVLASEHPEWFYHKPDGSFGNRVGDWTDIIDLDYSNPGLWDYQIETLKMWAQIVDGFRCDVAPLVPLAFWLRARREVEEVRPGCFWLAESVEPEFIISMRERGLVGHSDSEMYQAFDVCYDYDIFGAFRACLKGELPLADYIARVAAQEYIYPDNYVKLRYLENHDNTRAAFLLPDESMLLNWTAFIFFQKGLTLIYGGQECGAAHLPSLFDRDSVAWDTGRDYSGLFARLSQLKKDPLFSLGAYSLSALPGGVIRGSYALGERRALGVFCTRARPALIPVDWPNGTYVNQFDGSSIEIHAGMLSTAGGPVIILN